MLCDESPIPDGVVGNSEVVLGPDLFDGQVVTAP